MTHRSAIAGQRGGAAWTPALPTPEGSAVTGLWLDAAAITGLSDGAAVALWPDASGNDYHAAQATPGYRPTYKTGVLNGRPVIRFDGSDDYVSLSGGMGLFRAVGAATVFAVVANVATQSFLQAVIVAFTNTVGWARLTLHFAANPAEGSTAGGRRLDTNGYSIVSNSAPIGAASILRASFLWQSSDLMLSANGGTPAVNSSWQNDGVTSDSDSLSIMIGASMNTNSSLQQPLKGDIAELIVYIAALSATDISAVESYLSAKWGIATA